MELTCAGYLDHLFSNVPLSGDGQYEEHAVLPHTRRHTPFQSVGVIFPARHDGVLLATQMVEASNGDHVVPNNVGDERA